VPSFTPNVDTQYAPLVQSEVLCLVSRHSVSQWHCTKTSHTEFYQNRNTADEVKREAGTNYWGPTDRHGGRGLITLHMFFVFLDSIIICRGRDSSVGTATGYRLDGPGIESQ